MILVSHARRQKNTVVDATKTKTDEHKKHKTQHQGTIACSKSITERRQPWSVSPALFDFFPSSMWYNGRMSLFTIASLTDGRSAWDLPKQHPEKKSKIFLQLQDWRAMQEISCRILHVRVRTDWLEWLIQDTTHVTKAFRYFIGCLHRKRFHWHEARLFPVVLWWVYCCLDACHLQGDKICISQLAAHVPRKERGRRLKIKHIWNNFDINVGGTTAQHERGDDHWTDTRGALYQTFPELGATTSGSSGLAVSRTRQGLIRQLWEGNKGCLSWYRISKRSLRPWRLSICCWNSNQAWTNI